MQIDFCTNPKAVSAELLKKLQSLSTDIAFFETLLLEWVSDCGRLSVCGYPEAVGQLLVITLEERGIPVAYSQINNKQAVKQYGKFIPLREEAFYEGPARTPDEDWFSKRNERLGIYFDSKLDHYILPAESMTSMIFSYGFSSAGMVRFRDEFFENSKSRLVEAYQADFIFFGEDFDQGWQETLIIIREDLERQIGIKCQHAIT